MLQPRLLHMLLINEHDAQARAESSSRSMAPSPLVSAASNIASSSSQASSGIGGKPWVSPKETRASWASSLVMVISPVVSSLTIQSSISYSCSAVKFSHLALMWDLTMWCGTLGAWWVSLTEAAVPRRATRAKNLISSFCFFFVFLLLFE